jgi:hypothetical protein
MTNDERMTKPESQMSREYSLFDIRHSFVIRHSTFVIHKMVGLRRHGKLQAALRVGEFG